MKLPSLVSRAILPIPLGCGVLLFLWLIAAAVRRMGNDGPLLLPDGELISSIVLVTVALQIVVGIVSTYLLRGKPLWVYLLVGFGFGVVISAFSGEISLFGSSPVEGEVAAQPEFDLPRNVGMLGITVPAMVFAYAVSWWRFTLVPRKKRQRKRQRRQRGRLSREEIANSDISGHQKAALPPGLNQPRTPKQRRGG